MNNQIHFIGRLLVFCIFFLSFNACTDDPIIPSFDGPSEITISFLGGKIAGKTFSMESNSITDDHVYFKANNLNKIYIQPLKKKLDDSLDNSSFINWAWTGANDVGTFKTIHFSDPNLSKTGDYLIQFTNGDEFTGPIPSLNDIKIIEYTDNFISGEIQFTEAVDIRFGTLFTRENIPIKISFKIKRGIDM